eukprot:COSAG06_NODE_1656_length_8785_cov_23.725996_1_plen_54_part_00
MEILPFCNGAGLAAVRGGAHKIDSIQRRGAPGARGRRVVAAALYRTTQVPSTC